MREILSQPFWDDITLGATAVRATLFQTLTSKTLYDTNMTVAGAMPSDNFFKIKGIAFSQLPGQTGALLIALQKGTLELFVGSSSKLQIPLFMLTSGAGIGGIVSASTETVNAGIPDPRAIYTLDNPIDLNAGVNFKVECVWPVAPTASTFWVFLLGDLDRPAAA
jgi:hypothetical protein